MTNIKLATLLLTSTLLACHGPNAELGDSSLMEDGSFDWQASIMENYAGEPGWPRFPRKIGNINKKSEQDTFIYLGVEMGFLDFINVGSKFGFTAALSRTTNLLLVKHAPRGITALTTVGDDGEIYLAYDENLEFVGMCNFLMDISLGHRWKSNLNLGGSGFEYGRDERATTEIVQTSNFFKIEEHDTIPQLQKKCDRIYHRSIKREVAADFKRMIKSRHLTEANDKDPFLVGIRAAIYGPAQDNVEIYDYKLNIKATSYQRTGRDQRGLKVHGHLSKHRTFFHDEQFYFTISMVDGQIIASEYTHNADGWEEAARRFAKEVAYEMYMEYGAHIDEVQLVEAPTVTAFEKEDFEGKSLTLGVGRYNNYMLSKLGLDQDKISSIKVPDGLIVRLYDWSDFAGPSIVLLGEERPRLPPAFNNKVSSIIVEKNPKYTEMFPIKVEGGHYLSSWNADNIPNSISENEGPHQFYLEKVEHGYFKIIDAVTNVPIRSESTYDATHNDQWFFEKSKEDDSRCYFIINRASQEPISLGDELSFCF